MQKSTVNKAFDKLVESCPHGEPNPQCPLEVYRFFIKEGLDDVAEICSDYNKELMLKYHAVCNKIRTAGLEKKIPKAG